MLLIIEVFLYTIMTLKQYLTENKVNASPDQRSRIGLQISKLNHNFDYIKEDSFTVKFYDENFLNSNDVYKIIINELNK